MTMIEKVARVMASHDGFNPDALAYPGEPYRFKKGYVVGTATPAPLWMFYASEARAAIEAMREPTEVVVHVSKNSNPA